MSKSADVGQATKGCSVLPVPQSGRAEFRLHPLCQLAPARHTAGAFSRYTEEERRYELRGGCGRNCARKPRVWIYSDELGHCRKRT